jgi:Transposase DDE domain
MTDGKSSTRCFAKSEPVANGVSYLMTSPRGRPSSITTNGAATGPSNASLDTLRRRAREEEGREEERSLGIADSQSVKTTEVGGEKGFDAGKKVKGRKRHLLVDIVGFLVVVCVTAASVQDARCVAPVAARSEREIVTARSDPR